MELLEIAHLFVQLRRERQLVAVALCKRTLHRQVGVERAAPRPLPQRSPTGRLPAQVGQRLLLETKVDSAYSPLAPLERCFLPHGWQHWRAGNATFLH